MKIFLKNLLLILCVIFSVSSCIDKEKYLDVQNPYNQYWVNSFGDIPEGQSWDFYSQLINGLDTNYTETRAISRNSVSYTYVNQPTNIDFTEWQTLLKSGENNSAIGTHSYSLTSNGSFYVYPVWYAGWYEIYAQYNFELGIYYNNKYTKIFGGCNEMGNAVAGTDYSRNPNLGAEVNIPKGGKFQFYIRYTLNNKRYTYVSNSSEYDCSTLLYSNNIDNDGQIMVIGFEDQPTGDELDFNDVILYIKGNTELPIPEAKRFMCEDQGSIGDFDFNDVVFDIQPLGNSNAIITLQACGGTLPINLYINDNDLGEIHSLFGVSSTTMVNTGFVIKEPVKLTVNVGNNFDLTTFNSIKLAVTNGSTKQYITYREDGNAPAVIVTPINAKWMKETQSIKLGYPNFFTTNWFNTFNSEYLY